MRIPWNKGKKGLQVSSRKGKTGIYSKETIEKMRLARLGKTPWNKGIPRTPDERKKISESRKGISAWNKGRKTSEEEKKKINMSGLERGRGWFKGKKRYDISGSRCHLWRGGITPINKKIRASLDYKLWRDSVFKRDNYTCVWCGARCGNGKVVTLNADHIKPFAYFPELRFAIDNGRTLCKDCHRKTDTFAGKIRHIKN